MPSPQVSILIYGQDFQLLETRRLVLERSGARVWTAIDLDGFMEIAPAVSIDLVILCHSLSMEQCGRALALAHTCWPQVQCLVLISGRCGCHPGLSDQVADAAQGPAYLLDRVAKLVGTEQPRHSHAT